MFPLWVPVFCHLYIPLVQGGPCCMLLFRNTLCLSPAYGSQTAATEPTVLCQLRKCVRAMAFRRWLGASEIIPSPQDPLYHFGSHVWIPQMLRTAGCGMYVRNSASIFCECLCLLILSSILLLSESFLGRLNFLCGVMMWMCCLLSLKHWVLCWSVLQDYGKGVHLLRIEGARWGLCLGLLPLLWDGSAQWPLQFPVMGHWLILHIEMGPRELTFCWEEEVSLLKFSACMSWNWCL